MQAALLCKPFAATANKAARAQAPRRVLVLAQATKPAAAKELPAALKPALLTVASNVLLSLPAHAEAGKIFDFNFTLPVMMGEFLLLMVFLDKFWFGPVGKVLDERDQSLRGKLALVKDNGSEVAKLQAEAEKLIADARAAAQKQVAEAKALVSAECAKELAEAKAKVDAELSRALATLESEKEAAMKSLDAQVEKLSADILGRVLPEGVKV